MLTFATQWFPHIMVDLQGLIVICSGFLGGLDRTQLHVKGGLLDRRNGLWRWVGGVRRRWLGRATPGSLSAVSSFRPPDDFGTICDGSTKPYGAPEQEFSAKDGQEPEL